MMGVRNAHPSPPISSPLLLLLLLLLYISAPCTAQYQVINEPEVPTDSPADDTAIRVNASNPITKLSPPQCVDSSQNQGWLSLTGPIEAKNCAQALNQILETTAKYKNQSFLFYSRQMYPQGPGGVEGIPWMLPVGAETSFEDGNCVAIVRMRRDFNKGILPFEVTPVVYAPIGGVPYQASTWDALTREMKTLISTCAGGSQPRKNSWSLVGDIVVGFWPRNSPIDQLYGFWVEGSPNRAQNDSVESLTGKEVAIGVEAANGTGPVSTVTLVPSITLLSVEGGPSATQSYAYPTNNGGVEDKKVKRVPQPGEVLDADADAAGWRPRRFRA